MNIISYLDNLQNNLARINLALSEVDKVLSTQAKRKAEFVQSINKTDNNVQKIAKEMDIK